MTRERAARRLAAVAACAVALALTAPAATTAATVSPAPHQLTLRLPDVGPSYELGSSRCGQRSSYEEGEWPSVLPGLAARFPHRGCVLAFAESWTTPGASPLPDYVMSAAFVFADTAGPTAALRQPRAIAARILDTDRRALIPVPPTTTVGDEMWLLQLDGYPVPGLVALWQSGPVIALVLAGDRRRRVRAPAVLGLAVAQQQRIATPTPLLPADLDDIEVPLNDPRLGVPVTWLGRELPAHGRLPALRLLAIDGPSRTAPRLEPRAGLSYGARGGTDYVNLSLWKPRRIRRSLRAPQLSMFCPRRIDAAIEGVNATIVGYVDPATRHCEGRGPDVWTAVAFFRDVAVTIEASACDGCRRRGAYASPAGLRAIIRALRPRPVARAQPPVAP